MRLRLGLAACASLLLALFTITPASPVPATGCDAPIGDPFVAGAGHNHADPAHHAYATSNYELVGRLNPADFPTDLAIGAPVVDETMIPIGDQHDLAIVRAAQDADGRIFGEVSVVSVPLAIEGTRLVENGRYAALAGISAPLYVYIIDVKDPAAPKIVGKWQGPSGGYITDVKWSTGGQSLYAAVQGSSQSGLFLVDALDKTAPRTAEYWKVPNGVHMIGSFPDATLPGTDVVYGATGYSNGVFVARATADLPVKSFQKLPTVTGITAHDVWLTKDPITAKALLYVANSYGGVVVFDVSDPAAPARLGSWNGEPGLYMHTIRAMVQDGKRTIVVSPEYFGGSSGRDATLYALDATDFSNMRLIGTWSTPGNHAAGSLVWSTHAFQLVDNKIYLAHYHGGVWVIDAANPAAMQTLGYYLPHSHTYTGSAGSWGVMRMVPSDWDVVLHEGRQYVGDISGGLYVLRYACDTVGPGGPTSSG